MTETAEGSMTRREPYRVAVYVAQHDRTVRYDADAIPDCCALVAAGAAEVTVYRGPIPVDHFNTFLW